MSSAYLKLRLGPRLPRQLLLVLLQLARIGVLQGLYAVGPRAVLRHELLEALLRICLGPRPALRQEATDIRRTTDEVKLSERRTLKLLVHCT